MRYLKRFILFVLFSIVLLAIGLAVGKNAIFKSLLTGALEDLRKDRGVQISYDSAALGLMGGVRIEKIKVVDIATEAAVVEDLDLEVDFGWFGLIGSPVTIDRLSANGAKITLVSGLVGPTEEETAPSGKPSGENAPSTQDEPFRILVRQLVVADTILLYPQEEGEAVSIARVEGKAANLSLTEAFDFEVAVVGEGAGQGTAKVKGKIDPTTYDTDVALAIGELTFPMGAESFPPIRGEATLVLKNSFSNVSSKGRLETSAAPPGLPQEILAGTGFALDWKVASDVADGGAGKVELSDFRIQVEGLKGGTQALTGSGSYDPTTSQGEFQLVGRELSAPLFNAAMGSDSGFQVARGNMGIDLFLSRTGPDAPFNAGGNISLTNLGLVDTTGGGNDLEFKTVALDLAADYSPQTGLLNLEKLSISVDEIPVAIRGKVSSLMDEAARELDLTIAGNDLDVGRLAALAGGALAGVGTLSGKADIDLKVSGKTASDKFPILDGSLNAKGLTFVPAASPEMTVSVTGGVKYDSATIRGEALSLKLADVPGKLSFRVEGYNEPRKAVAASVTDFALAPVLQLVAPEKARAITGNLNGNLQATLVSGEPPEGVSVDFEIKDCRILTGENPIPKGVADSLGWKWLEGNYPLTEASGKVRQAGTGYQIESFRLVGKGGGISLVGSLEPEGNQFAGTLALLAKGEPTGSEVALDGNLDPNKQSGKFQVGLKNFSYPTPDGPTPRISGKLTAEIAEGLSGVFTKGHIAMAKPPQTIPQELSAGTPFEVDWTFDGEFPDSAGGHVRIKELDLGIKGLKGGPQSLKGNGNYDQETMSGEFSANGKGLSLPLVNPFLEPAAGMRVLSGKGDLALQVSREGEKSPFHASGDLTLSRLSVKDLSGERPNMNFESIGLKLESRYSETSDRLEIENLSVRVENIPLNVSGKIEAFLDAEKRSLDLSVKGRKLDVGRLTTLAAPPTAKSGSLLGEADVDVKVSGGPSSDKFPILVGSITTPGLTYIPPEGPDQKIGMRGTIVFDSDTLTADSMDITVAETPGKLSLKVRGYNEPIRKVDATLSGIDIDPVLRIYQPSAAGIVTGKLDATIDTLMGQRSRPEQLDIQFKINDGVLLTRHPLPSAIVKVIGWDWLRDGIRMNNAKGHIVQDERGYRLENILLMGEKGGLTARGWVGFDNKMDIEMRVNVAKANAAELNPILQKVLRAKPDSPWAYLGFDVTGKLGGIPIVLPQFDGVLGAGLDQVRERYGTELQERYGDEIRERTGIDTNEVLEGAEGLIRGIFNRDKQ